MASEDSKPKSETDEISNKMSKLAISVILIAAWGVALYLIIYCLDMISFYQAQEPKNAVKPILTPFIFAGIVFISVLVFTDSLMKTIKYNYRTQESLIGNILQALSVGAIAAWIGYKGIK